MIDPFNITKFDRTENELQEFLLFCIAVAGKRADQTREALADFLFPCQPDERPFEYVRWLDEHGLLYLKLKHFKLTPHKVRARGFREAAQLKNLRTISVARLEQVHGIGPKTARFFVLHSRRDERLAVLDTHILTFLRELGYTTPKQTPQSPRRYKALEDAFLNECDKRGLSPAEFDLMVWKSRSKSRD